MKIILDRYYKDEKSTIGNIKIFKKRKLLFSATTLENTKEIVEQGDYYISYTLSRKFQKHKWEIITPNRRGIRIHSANIYLELRGCLALGSCYRDDVLFGSRKIVEEFERILRVKINETIKFKINEKNIISSVESIECII